LRAGTGILAIAAAAAIALAGLGGEAEAQVAYTATSVDRSTTDLEFNASLRAASGTLGMGGTVDAAEWRVHDIGRLGSAIPALSGNGITVTSATVRELGSTPVIRLSHNAINNSPYPIVQYSPASPPGLSGSGAAISTAAVAASPSLPAFTAEVRDGAQVRIAFGVGGIMERSAFPIRCGENVRTPIAEKYLVFFHPMSENVGPRDYDCAGKNDMSVRYPSGWTNELASGHVTLSFAGEHARDLRTSDPVIVFGHRGHAYYHTAAGNMLNGTAVVATDNASPVAFASFRDADTITVEFSEEMARPSQSVLGAVAVTGPGGAAVPVSGTPSFTAHADATATTTFRRPALEIELSSFASPGMHTVSFPGMEAAGGPAGKRAVADAEAAFADTFPPTFSAEVRDGGVIELTFSEPVRREAARAVDDGTIYHHTYASAAAVAPGMSRAAALAVEPSSVSFTDSTTSMTLTFTGDAQRRLLTSTPRVGYAHADMMPVLEDEQDNAMLPAVITATDNASPVAWARFSAGDEIQVTFSEEMRTPTDAELDAIAVSAGGQAVAVSGRPAYAPHVAATASAPITLPTITIGLEGRAALDTPHTISFGSIGAAAGPAGKRAVADATATLTDATAPTFVVHKVSNTRLLVTFSEEVEAVPGTTAALDDWEVDATPGDLTDAAVNPTAVELGHNYADLTIAAVGGAVLPAVRYAEPTSTIRDLAGNALPVGEAEGAAAFTASLAAPIPLSAAHTRTSAGASQVAVTFSEAVKGTTAAGDWAVGGVTSALAVAFTSPSSTVTLSGFTLPPDATPDVSFTGTSLTEDTATSPEAADARSVRASDGIVPTVASARMVSDSRIEVTMSEAVAFSAPGTAGDAAEATGHWRTVLSSAESAVVSVGISGPTVTLAGDGRTWTSAAAPDVRYTRTVEEAGDGEVVDANGNALADVTFTMVADAAQFAASSAATSDALLDIGDQRDPADNTHTEYVTVRLSEPARLTPGTEAQRAGHWTVRDGGASPPADVAVSAVAFVDGSDRDVRLTLGGPLSGTAATPQVSYSSAMSAGRLVSGDGSIPLPSFGPIEARDGIGPRLVAYPESVRITDAMGNEVAVKVRDRNTALPRNSGDNGDQQELVDTTGRRYLQFTFSEAIDPASVGGSESFSHVSHRSQIASGELLRGLTGRHPVVLNDGNSGTSWLPATFKLLRSEDAGGALTVEYAGQALHGLGVDGMDRTADDPVTPPASPYLGEGGRVVTYYQGSNPAMSSAPVQDIFGFVFNAPTPRDLAGNDYRTNRQGAPPPADESDPTAYDPDTRGIHGTFIVAHDTAAPLFRATATGQSTVQAVYMEPVEIDAAAPAMAASHWRLDMTPNDSTDNTDGFNWLTPTGISTEFSAFGLPEYYAFGAPDHTTPTDSRLTVTLTGITPQMAHLDPQLKSASPDARPTLHYVGGAGAGFVPAVVDKYGNRAEVGGTARLVDTTPPSASASFTDEDTIAVVFDEALRFNPGLSAIQFNVHDAAGEIPNPVQSDSGSTVTLDLSISSAGIFRPARDGAHEVRIVPNGRAMITDAPSPGGTPSPRAWTDPSEIGASHSLDLPGGNAMDLPATLAVPALPPAPTFTAETSSPTEVTVTFQVGGMDAGLVRKATGALDAANWAVELVPAGETRTGRTATTNDDIAVTAVAPVPATGTPITGVTITLDGASPNIGDSSKRVYVTYTEGGASESEFQTAAAANTIQRSLLEGTGALAADGVPPGVAAEITAANKITLTFAEALGADPTTGIEYAVTVPDGSDTGTDPDAVALSTNAAEAPAYTAAAGTSPATVVLTTAANIDASLGDHTVTISAASTSPGSIVDENMAALALPAMATAAAPSAPTFTARTSSNTEIVLTFDQPVGFSDRNTMSLVAGNWIVDPDGADMAGMDMTGNNDADDITVSSATLSASERTVTLALDPADAQLGDTSKTPYVEYTASTSEIANLFSSSLAAGTSATAADGAPPTATAAFTDEGTVTLTFSEALGADPAAAMSGNTFGVHTAGGGDNLASPAAPVYTAADGAATPPTPATLAIALASPAATEAHEVRVSGTGTINDGATPPNALDKSAAIAVPAPPAAPTFTAETRSNASLRINFSADVVDTSGSYAAANWAVELVPAGEDRTARTATTEDDIAVTALSPQFTNAITLTLDAISPNIGDTSKRVFVTYLGDPSEFSTAAGTNAIARSLPTGSAALSTDRAPPRPSAEVTGVREVTLTFPEALSADPTRAGITYFMRFQDDPGAMTSLLSTTDLPSYTAADPMATPPTLPTVVLTSAADLQSRGHVVRITPTVGAPIADAGGASFTSAIHVIAPLPPPPSFTAAATAWAEIVVTFDRDVRLTDGTTSLSASNWVVDPDGSDGATNDAADDITVTAATFSAAARTVTLALDSTDDQIGDTTKTPYVEYTAATASSEIASSLGRNLVRGTHATATDSAPPAITGFATGYTGAPGPDPADPADNVYTDHIDVAVSEPVILEAGATAQQRAGHWTVENDHDGDAQTPAVAIPVEDAALVLADAADTSSRTVRLTLAGDAPLGGTTAAPTVAYDAASSASGRVVLPGQAASAASLAASVPATPARDGAGPRLVGLPVRGDFTPDTPNDDDRGALVFTFSEDLDPATVRPAEERATMIVARIQVEPGSPTGRDPPLRHDHAACPTGTRWLPAIYTFAGLTEDSMSVADLVDIVPGQVTDGEGGMEAGMVRGTQANTVRLNIAGHATDGPQGTLWACFTKPSANFEGWVSGSALRDTAGNPYISVEETPHTQFLMGSDSRAPEFTATVTGPTAVSVFYDEPVRLAAGASLDASEWTVDTTPNDGDSTNAVAASSISHSFGPMLRPEYWLYGAPDHSTPADARLRIDLTFDGLTLDPNQAAPAMGAADERPRVTYTSSATAADVVDVYGTAAASPASVQARDTIPPEVESIRVEVSTASTEGAPVPNRQHARASSASPVDVKFTVTFNEAPKPGTPPILGVLPSSALTATSTLPATSSSQDTQRIWAMSETAADDGHAWEYTWTVTNPLPGETTARNWDSGFGLAYGIVVQDAEGNAIAYNQDTRYPAGSTPTVTLDSAPPVVRATSMVNSMGDAPTGKDGSIVELHFTVDERADRLVTPVTGPGGTVTYEAGLAPSAVRFFSGADETAATSLTGTGTAVDPYVATAAIPAGHVEGTDVIEWSITVLDIYGQEGTTDHTDIGTTGHTPSLGFTVDNTAPMIMASMSSVGADRTGGSRAATDALAPVARGGEALLVDITFDEALDVRAGAEPPKVRGYGEILVFGEDGRATYAERQFHEMSAMTAVAGTGGTRWQHSYTVPDAATLEIHDASYMVDVLMPADEAGNSMTFTAYRGGQDVRIDNVAPSVTGMSFVHGEANSRGAPVPWAALEYTEHGGLRTDGLRAYVNMTRLDPNANGGDFKAAGAGTLLVRVGEFSSTQCIAATPTCTAPNGEGRNSFTTFYLQFDYGGTASPTGLTDIAGNAVTWDQPVASPDRNGDSHPQPSAFRTSDADYFAGADDPITVTGLPHRDSVSLADVGLEGSGELDFDVTYESPTMPGLSILLAEGTRASNLGDPPEIMLAPRVAVHGLPGEDYYTALLQDGDHEDEDERTLRSLASQGARATIESGRADAEVLLSAPARLTIPGAANALRAYWIEGAGTPGQADDRVHDIQECRRSSVGAADAEDVPGRAGTDPTTYDRADNAECYVREASTGSLHIWTNHFTPFGASAESERTGGSGCDDCTPPTLGVDTNGVRRVAGGFTYNGAAHNVDYYYTPMPLIEVETGVENVAVLKIFEDSGASRLAHAGLAFGLGRGQHFAESEAEIRVSISHSGELSIALDDPSGAIDAETLRASHDIVECMPGSSAECVEVTIHHTFREPLDFDVVSTNVWDTRRNAWQNFYNHGVHVSGDSLNPSRGIEVNGGGLVLYPLISGRVDADGDGIYDYDERHVTYMLDEGYGVWRLTPDGTYAPLRNLYALHHEVDDAMYADGRIRTHGAERSSALFAEELARQAAIAEGIMAELGIGVPEREAPAAAPSPYDGMAAEPRLERLSEAIAAEINVAERLMGKISPALARR